MDSSRCGRDVARYAVVRTSWVGTGSLASEQVVGRGGPAVEGPGDTFMPDIANAGRARQATLPASAPPSAWALVRAGRRRSLVWLAVAVAVSVLAACSPSPPDNGPPVDLQFEKYTLGNGLEVILREDDRVPIAAVNLWYHVGPANEAAGRTGFAHLFEHMMFQGSGHTGPDAHDTRLRGGRRDGRQRLHHLRLHRLRRGRAVQRAGAGAVAGERPDGLPARRPRPGALSNQQRVVRSERRETTESVPYGLSDEALISAPVPRGPPVPRQRSSGRTRTSRRRSSADVRDFFAHYYVPNNASLTIVGRHRRRGDESPDREVLRHHPARTRRARAAGRDTTADPGAATDRHRPGRAAARDHGLGDPTRLRPG